MPYVDDDPTANYTPGDMGGNVQVDNKNTTNGYSGHGYTGNSGQTNVQVNNYNNYQSTSTPYTNTYTEQSVNPDYRDTDNDNILGEFVFSIALIAVAFIVPHIFFGIKKLLKRLHWLSPRVLKMIDRLEVVFLKVATKLSNRGVGKVLHTKGPLQGHESAFIVKDTLDESLKEKLYVAPDLPGEESYVPPTIEGEGYANTNVEASMQNVNTSCNTSVKQEIKEDFKEFTADDLHFKTDVDEDDPSDPHAIIRKYLKEPL